MRRPEARPREQIVTAAAEETQYRLLILGEGSVRTHSLTGTRWTIGRSPDCCIQLRDVTVSRRHLLLERVGDEFRFQDLGSANPPQVDGRPTHQGTLAVGQTLSIGLTRLMLETRARPTPVATNPTGTVVLSREVIDDEEQLTSDGFPATAARVLERIEWTFADLGDLCDAAEPLLDLALNLTGRQSGWMARFHQQGGMETLATVSTTGRQLPPHLPQNAIDEARRLGKPHLLATREADERHDRLLIPLGNAGDGLIVLEDADADAPRGQEVLRLAQSLGTVVWHRLQETLERRSLRTELDRLRFHGTVAHNAILASTRLQPVREQLRAFAATPSPVLLLGEDGTERADLARYLHTESPQRLAAFWSWCAGKVSAVRQATELFGDGESPGLLARTGDGTLFVDDVTRLPQDLQRRLAKELKRSRDAGQQLRLVVATHPDDGDWADELQALFADGRVRVPALREDARDVLALAELFLSELGTHPDGSPRLMTERAKRALTDYSWPGNVRELRLAIEAASAAARGQPIAPRHLPASVVRNEGDGSTPMPTLADVERAHIAAVMQHTGGVRQHAAQILGIASSTLYEKLKKYRIEG